ncbi:MAG TPA: DMT family transporter [Gaiellaceae bacterium]|nr:DMT family transporter [Gaiellaceae bacterium]
MIAIVLALGASVCWGVGDFLGGVSARRLRVLGVLAISQAAGFVAVALVAPFAGGDFLGTEASLAAVGAGCSGAIGLAALYRGMAVGAIGVVAPISASAAVIPVAVGITRGERPATIQLVGVALALIGVVLVSREHGQTGRLAAGVPLALVAAAGFGSYFLFIDRASADDAFWAVTVARLASSALALTAAAVAGALRVPRASLPVLIAVGLFDVGANVLLALALNEGFVSLVSVLASLYPVVTIMLAIAVLHERPGREQAIGGAAALVGVGLISAAA